MSKTSNFLATQVLDATERTWPNTTCVQQLIEAQVGKSPDAIAVEDDKQTLTIARYGRKPPFGISAALSTLARAYSSISSAVLRNCLRRFIN